MHLSFFPQRSIDSSRLLKLVKDQGNLFLIYITDVAARQSRFSAIPRLSQMAKMTAVGLDSVKSESGDASTYPNQPTFSGGGGTRGLSGVVPREGGAHYKLLLSLRSTGACFFEHRGRLAKTLPLPLKERLMLVRG